MTNQDIKTLCAKLGIEHYQISGDDDGPYIDVFDSVDLKSKRLEYLPLRFGIVHGNFDCRNNYLTSLKGAPFFVDGSFRASFNKLTNLDYFPMKVVGFIVMNNNHLTSLKGIPIYDNSSFKVKANLLWFGENPLKSEDYYHLFDKGYDCCNIKRTEHFDLESIKRQWVIHNIAIS